MDHVSAYCPSRSVRVAMLLQNSRSVPWLIWDRRLDVETTAPPTRPLASPDRVDASWRMTPRQNFPPLNSTTADGWRPTAGEGPRPSPFGPSKCATGRARPILSLSSSNIPGRERGS